MDLSTSLPNDKTLEEIIQRIVEVAKPEKIILFGSAAREDKHLSSNLDLLIVKSGAHRRKLAPEIYMNLFGVGRAVDIVVLTPEDIERYQDPIGLTI